MNSRPEQVLSTIERKCISIIDALEAGLDPAVAIGLPQLACTKQLDKHGIESHDGAAQLANVLKVMRSSYDLLSSGATASQRELYYLNAQHWAGQDESQAALRLTNFVLQVPKHKLGFFAASRGWIAGAVVYEDTDAHPTYEAKSVPADAVGERIPVHLADDVDFILVVEKECIFRRLCEDKVWDLPGLKCCLVTGCGFPDLATRALVHQLWSESGSARFGGQRVPVYGLGDWNIFGLGVMLSYTRGSKTHPESAAWAVPVQWLGLRAGDIDYYELPTGALQATSAIDEQRAVAILRDPVIQASQELQEEVAAWIDSRQKMELEGILGRGLNFLARVYLPTKIAEGDAIPLMTLGHTQDDGAGEGASAGGAKGKAASQAASVQAILSSWSS